MFVYNLYSLHIIIIIVANMHCKRQY